MTAAKREKSREKQENKMMKKSWKRMINEANISETQKQTWFLSSTG